MSRLVIIHGPPAAGKLTVARQLAVMLGAQAGEHSPAKPKLLHNHVTLNTARVLFDIGDPRLVELHRRLRLTLLESGFLACFDLITTMVYAEPESVEHVGDIVALSRRHEVELISVFLDCARSELMTRVESADREAEGKLQSRARLESLLETSSHPPIPGLDTICIDNTRLSPSATARLILENLSP